MSGAEGGKELTRSDTVTPAVKGRGLLMPLYDAGAMIALHDAVAKLIAEVFKEGRDFGKIPGTERPTLLKPGQERICTAFGAGMRYEIVEKEIDHDRQNAWTKTYKNRPSKSGVSFGVYRYVIRAQVIRLETGEILGEGLGSCSTMESKYIDRPRDSENTVLKMGKKRAAIDAALSTFGLSDRFTQDVEEMKGAKDGEDAEEGTPARQPLVIDTLEHAKKLPIPGGPKAWGGYGGKEFDAAPTKVLSAIYKWADEKIQKAGSEGHEPDGDLIAWKKAAELILKDRNVGGPKGEASAAEGQAAPAAAPAPAEEPAPKRPVDCCATAKATGGVDHDEGCEHFDDLPF